ncbi:MAG: antibiotic biosynthesis monooxygenase [Chloroflexota bacterium]|nr:antibiotic biosynthesis monooxygenase [Chloroflexota bacterium]
MSVVKINAITPTEGMEGELEARFGRRAREVEHMEGFEGFELLRPVEGDDRYFVYTRWRSEEDFQRWVNSEAFNRGHAQRDGNVPVATHSALLSFEVVEWPEAAEVDASR